MRTTPSTLVLACALSVCAGHTLDAQSGSGRDSKKTNPARPLTLVGCVGPADAIDGQFTLLDSTGGSAYRLSGANMREYVGRRVQVVGGSSSRRLHIAGGLVPSPNVAAQAGAIDPSRAAIAAAEAGSADARRARMPEFRVKSVQTLAGACPAR
jgi:hypothetical protein